MNGMYAKLFKNIIYFCIKVAKFYKFLVRNIKNCIFVSVFSYFYSRNVEFLLVLYQKLDNLKEFDLILNKKNTKCHFLEQKYQYFNIYVSIFVFLFKKCTKIWNFFHFCVKIFHIFGIFLYNL